MTKTGGLYNVLGRAGAALNHQRHPPFVWHPGYSCEWPAKHTFPMCKFTRLKETVLAQGLVLSMDDFWAPSLGGPSLELFEAVHEKGYLHRVVNRKLSDQAGLHTHKRKSSQAQS